MIIIYAEAGYWSENYLLSSPASTIYYCDAGYWSNDYCLSPPAYIAIAPENIVSPSKLMSYFHRVFDQDTHQFLAIRLNYSGSMTWVISNGYLTTSTSSPVNNLNIRLSDYTIASLVDYLNSQAGYSILYVDMSGYAGCSARVFIDGSSGDQAQSNGDHIYGYTSLLWAYISAFSSELSVLKQEIVNAIAQMNLQNSTDYWAEYHGGYYGIPRNHGETDPAYAQRIIVQVLMPRGNNVAIESALLQILGAPVTVVDVVTYLGAGNIYDGAFNFDGSHLYNNTGASVVYGLFDINYSYNIESGSDLSGYIAQIRVLVETLRDAGTQLRVLNLVSSQLNDDANLLPTDSAQITISYGNYYDGAITYNGAGNYAAISTETNILS